MDLIFRRYNYVDLREYINNKNFAIMFLENEKYLKNFFLIISIQSFKSLSACFYYEKILNVLLKVQNVLLEYFQTQFLSF